MALSLPQAARRPLRDFLLCFSYANLCFLKRWYDLEHLQSRAVDYFRSAPPNGTLLVATLISVVVLSLVLWLAVTAVRRTRNPSLLALMRAAGTLIMIYPMEEVRRYWNLETERFDWISNLPLLGAEALLLAGAFMVLRGNLRVVRAGGRVLMLLVAALPVFLLEFAIQEHGAPAPSAFLDKPNLPMLPDRGSHAPRLIWLLFDELDQRLAFSQREPGLELPELDRLRSESLVSDHVSQTAESTVPAIPSLLSGIMFSYVEAQGADTLLVQPAGSSRLVDWRTEPNVFRRARQIGVNAAIIGWHHPYCRLLGDAVVDCASEESIHFPPILRERTAAAAGVWKTVGYLFRLQWVNITDLFRVPSGATSESDKDAEVQAQQQQQYFAIRDRAYQEAVDPRIGLLYVHFPTPHLFAIYNRQTKDFSLSSHTTYFDNLALVDRTLGELRRRLESAGLWDSTSLLITSDHGLRQTLWHNRLNWTPEFDRLLVNGQSPVVPFIAKLGGGHAGAAYQEPFSNLTTSDFAMAVLSGEISSPDQGRRWLARHLEPEALSARDTH